MRATKALGLLLTAAMVTLALSGCFPGRSVETKTVSIASALEGMSGVLRIEPSSTERGIGTPPYSAVWVTLTADATETEVVDILTAFTASNLATGVDRVSSQLKFVIDTDDPLVSERLTLDFAEADEQQLADLARAWFELRARYGGTDLGLIEQSLSKHPVGFDVVIGMPDDSTAATDLAAIRDVSALFAGIGPVTKVFEVDGRFEVSRELPGEATLALAESILATEGILDLSGRFYGDELVNLSARMSDLAGLVDFSIGVSPLMARTVDLIPQEAAPLRLSFRLGDARQPTVFFENQSCEPYTELHDGDESRALLLYWARDGRILLDGSTAASCFG